CEGPEDPWLFGSCGDRPVVLMFAHVLAIVNALAGVSAGALIVGMILCLDTRDGLSVDEEAAVLAKNLRQMRFQLYISGLVLTFGVLFATSWIYWPLLLVNDAAKDGYGAVLLSAALYAGTYFSLLMLSFYLPVALILEGRVRRLSQRAAQGGQDKDQIDLAKWRETHGLKEGASEYLRAGFALTGPVLAAFAGGISPLSL
ncbi:MAG: hypothetical protein AB8B58_15660, partial [Roseobacter sp.]